MVETVYGIEAWGQGLLEVLPNGDIGLLDPLTPERPAVPLPMIVRDLRERGIRTPIQLRVQSYLDYGVRRLCEAFAETMETVNYRGDYRGVFPIKVNQQSEVVGRIAEVGQQFSFGLEAGSKPELIIALAQPLARDALVICNGIKDDEFIRLAILSRKIGFKTVIVLESLKEFEIVRAVSEELGVKPLLGVRVKLTHTVAGKWEASSGDRSTFGLGTYELVQLIDRLAETGYLRR